MTTKEERECIRPLPHTSLSSGWESACCLQPSIPRLDCVYIRSAAPHNRCLFYLYTHSHDLYDHTSCLFSHAHPTPLLCCGIVLSYTKGQQ